MKRLIELFELLAAAVRIWRECGDVADVEIAAYMQPFDHVREDPVITVHTSDNAVHFNSKERRH